MKTLYTFSESGDGGGSLHTSAEQDAENDDALYFAGSRSTYWPTFM